MAGKDYMGEGPELLWITLLFWELTLPPILQGGRMFVVSKKWYQIKFNFLNDFIVLLYKVLVEPDLEVILYGYTSI